MIEPAGNCGDRLIRMGIEKKLNSVGIAYEILKHEENTLFPISQEIYSNFLIKF